MSSTDPLSDALAALESLEQAGLAEFGSAATPEAAEAARVDFLGQRQGRLKAAQERLKSLDPAGRRVYGQKFNSTKVTLEAALEAARSRLERRASPGAAIDVTLPGIRPRLGHRHPLTQTADELIDLFGRFGFAVARGPEVEDVYHNFDALNIPANHPARDPFENFYLAPNTEPSGTEAGEPRAAAPVHAGALPHHLMLRSQT